MIDPWRQTWACVARVAVAEQIYRTLPKHQCKTGTFEFYRYTPSRENKTVFEMFLILISSVPSNNNNENK